jgi:hypothetical protein
MRQSPLFYGQVKLALGIAIVARRDTSRKAGPFVIGFSLVSRWRGAQEEIQWEDSMCNEQTEQKLEWPEGRQGNTR